MKHVLCIPVLGSCLLLPPAAFASCGANGVCGTIVFLGKTADRSKAVFLSTTTTRGQYDVTPTSSTFPVDTWVTTGPDTRFSLSDQVANWGGTHALNYYPVEGGPIGSRVYIAGATQNPNGTVYPNDYRPPGRNTPVAVPQPVRLQTLPSATVSDKQPAQGPVVAPLVIETVTVQEPQVSEPVRGPLVPDTSGAATREVGPVPVLPGSQLSVTGQTPQQVAAPALMVAPGVSVRQTNTWPVVAPAANQTVTIQSPQVPQQVRGPELQTPPAISVRQTNTGPVVAPSGLQPSVVQGPQVPPLVQPPRDPVVVSGLTGVISSPGGGQGGELPIRPPTLTGGHGPIGTGRLPGTVSTKEPLQPKIDSTQNTSLGDANRPPLQRQLPPSWSASGDPCMRPQPRTVETNERQLPCDDVGTQNAIAYWVDLSSTRLHDNASGLGLRQRGEGLAAGWDRLVGAGLGVGIYASSDRQRGAMLEEVLQFKKAHTGAGAYVTKSWGEHWTITAGLHVGDETVTVDFLGFSGDFRTRTWTASMGLMGTHSIGNAWLTSRFNVEHARKRTAAGAITGEIAGLRLDVETPSSTDDFWVASAGIEVGTRLQLGGGTIVVPSVDVGVNRVAHGSRRDNPWQVDVRLGARVQWSPDTGMVLSYHRMGLNRADYRSEEWRATVFHRF